MINETIIVGRLTRDGELKHTSQGKQVFNFSIAVDTGTKEKPYTSYFDCVIWGKFAEVIGGMVKKGTQVVVEGSLRQDRWQDGNTTRSKVKINVDKVFITSGRQQGNAIKNDVKLDDIPF